MLARDLVDRLAAMPRLLQACAERLPRAEWTRQPAAGLFSLVEHCCHLRDLEEEGYTVRLRRMLRETGPVLEDFDGGAVAARRGYPAQDMTAGDAGLRRGAGPESPGAGGVWIPRRSPGRPASASTEPSPSSAWPS